MKIIIFALLFLPSFALADMAGLDFNFGQNTVPSYGADYEFQHSWQYLDVALSGNNGFLTPYLSLGYQGDIVNVGVGVGDTISEGTYHAIAFGPELGFMWNLTKLVYVKENNTYQLDQTGHWNYGGSVALGLNL